MEASVARRLAFPHQGLAPDGSLSCNDTSNTGNWSFNTGQPLSRPPLPFPCARASLGVRYSMLRWAGRGWCGCVPPCATPSRAAAAHTIVLAAAATRGQRSAHSLATGPVMAEPAHKGAGERGGWRSAARSEALRVACAMEGRRRQAAAAAHGPSCRAWGYA